MVVDISNIEIILMLKQLLSSNLISRCYVLEYEKLGAIKKNEYGYYWDTEMLLDDKTEEFLWQIYLKHRYGESNTLTLPKENVYLPPKKRKDISFLFGRNNLKTKK